MRSTTFALLACTSFSLFGTTAALAAREGEAPTTAQTPAGGTTVVQTTPGSGGVTVVAPTAGGGTVTATGCSTVVVQGNPTLVGPNGGPCPTYAPYQPYSAQPVYAPVPRYAPDPDRKAALLASTIFFGVGTGVAGIVYLIQHSNDGPYQPGYTDTSGVYHSGGYAPADPARARASLMTYGAILTLTPSIPRFVVGDTTKGLIFTGLRVASFATAALVDWGDKDDTKWQGPFLLGFAAPLTLGIIDLATTPHREDLIEKEKEGVTGVGVAPLASREGKTQGAFVSLQGKF